VSDAFDEMTVEIVELENVGDRLEELDIEVVELEPNTKDANVELVDRTDAEVDPELLRLEVVSKDEASVELVDDMTASVNGACEATAAPIEGIASLPVGVEKVVNADDEDPATGSGACV